MVDCEHKNHLFMFVNGIEESIVAYPVTPGLRSVTFKLFYVFAKIWLLFQLRIDVGGKFCPDAFLLATEVLVEIF